MSKVFTIAEGLENMGAIKTGGQGSVYKGRRIGEIITAIKLLPTPIFHQDESDKHYRDFSNEVAKLRRVNEEPNPNVVKFLSYGVSETGCFPYIEMEYIDGPDLCDLLKESPCFTIKEAIKVAEQLAHALAHCHRLDVKHGDVKSNNVKFNRHNGNYVLIDFGLAILSDEERRTSLRNAGAIEFMAPEQNEGHMYFETDIYSFGIVLYELLAGRVPFPLDGNSETARNKVMVAHMETPPPNLLSVRQENLPKDWDDEKAGREMQVPDWLLNVIYKCLEKDPANRYPNGVELYEAILQHSTQFSTVDSNSLLVTANREEIRSLQEQLKSKEEEIAGLTAVIHRQELELETVRGHQFTPLAARPASNGVSSTAFKTLLVLTVILGLVTVYSLFLSNRTAGAASDELPGITYTDSSANSNAAKTDDHEEENERKSEKVIQRDPLPRSANDSGRKMENVVVGNEAGEEEEEPKAVAQKKDTTLNKLPPPDLDPVAKPDVKKEESKKVKDTTSNGIE